MCIKEGSVCWYDGLSCKLNSVWLSKVQFLFFLIKIWLWTNLRAKVRLCSSMVERNTVNILIDVRFILRAFLSEARKKDDVLV
jgi:hypothetical protein